MFEDRVPQELADVPVDRPPLLDSSDDRREVVVGEDDVSSLLGDIGPGDSHGDPDIRGLERGGVVDAVTGHRDHLATSLQRLDDPELVLGVDARVDGHLAHGAVELFRSSPRSRRR